jgi:hypothetical protein
MTTDAPEFVEQETLRFLEKLSRANAVKVGTAS